MSSSAPSPWSSRFLAGVWFAGCGLLVSALLFLHPPIAYRAVVLYIALPSLAALIAGFWLGAPILQPQKTALDASLRGLAVAGVAYALFSLLFALTLPLLERGWSFTQAGGLLLMTLTLGLLGFGPWVLLAGTVAGLGLQRLARWREPRATAAGR